MYTTQLEQKTGLPRSRLLYIADKAEKADLNGDGRIVLSEWRQYLNRFGRDFLDRGVTAGVLRVLAYSPSYSCHPPTVFLLTMTAAQIVVFIMSVVAPETVGTRYEFGEKRWPIDSELIYDPHRLAGTSF